MTHPLVLIFIGGGLGSVCRHLVGVAVQRWISATLPLGTATVNLAGCLLIGLLSTLIADRWGGSEHARLALLVGFLGGFTTFSTFGIDALNLLRENRPVAAAAYVGGSVFFGVFAVWIGRRMGEALV